MDLPADVLEPGRAFILRLLASLGTIALGWVLAKLAKELVFRGLLTAWFDVASEKAGIDDVLMRADIRQSPAELVAVLVYWLVLLAALLASVSTLGLTQVSEVLNRCLVYAPRIIAAVVVLILGLFLASFLAGIIRAAAANAGMAESDALSALIRYAAVAFTAAVTLARHRTGAGTIGLRHPFRRRGPRDGSGLRARRQGLGAGLDDPIPGYCARRQEITLKETRNIWLKRRCI
jgi:hypothetical protein